MSDFDLTRFINREFETNLVTNRASELVNGKPYSPKERVFHFIGPSGIGKSSLLQKIYSLLTEKQYVVPILVRLDTLKDAKQEFAVELLKTVYFAFCKYADVATNPILKEPLTSSWEYASMITRAISLRKGIITVLSLDGVNILSQKEIREIEDYLLVKFLHANDYSILVTAGRPHPAMFNDFALRPNLHNIFPLPVFDEKKTSEQIRSLKPGSEVLANKIWKLGSGVPGNTVKLVDRVSDDNFNTLNEKLAIQSLLDNIKRENHIEERYYPILEAISILQGFFPEDVIPLFQSHPKLVSSWDEGKIKEVFLNLNKFQIGPGALIDWDRNKKYWVMDESTRNLFEKELQLREPELWKKLHCTAMSVYKKWSQAYASDMYKEKSNYHLQCLQLAGMSCE